MAVIHWFPFWKHGKENMKAARVVIYFIVVSIIILTWKMIGQSTPEPKLLTSCEGIQQQLNSLMASVELSGGLGNLMFQYSFLYVTCKTYGYQMVLPSTIELDNLKDTFGINVSDSEKEDWDKSLTEKCFQVIEDEWDCAYDAKLVEKSRRNVHYKGYFQSWKYLVKYEDDLREMFRFRPHILNLAASILHKAISSKINVFNNTGVQPTLVGVHVRRGDVLNDKLFVKYGYKVADYAYLKKAMAYFRNKFSNVLFIVCSNDLKWVRAEFGTTSDVFITKGNTPATDMALLSMTNHTIMTVGTFGWWISFLTNGETIYYKYPFVPGSPLSKQFRDNTGTHLYPHWVGMEGDETIS
ncbi:galactoside alpha-(1,2)-fucosyltransferase 2-like [Ylistrum balloti]|uniref:galactoside alpha-(1,2)-fucosyltransferase 2-like n=1 Tax=Ylistrum balloti TaxID=509963 RepID=UPI00290589A6|nr:galactoside alpha-(1,2)-fucosyltransferase 2-like [Ylistrum balloti]